jgi:hypothetical protein
MTCAAIRFEVRKATLGSVLAKAAAGLRLNEHIEGNGPTVFAHACKMGLEGMVSKRKDPPYDEARGGRGLAALTYLMLKRASASRPSGEWNDDTCSLMALSSAASSRFTRPQWERRGLWTLT